MKNFSFFLSIRMNFSNRKRERERNSFIFSSFFFLFSLTLSFLSLFFLPLFLFSFFSLSLSLYFFFLYFSFLSFLSLFIFSSFISLHSNEFLHQRERERNMSRKIKRVRFPENISKEKSYSLQFMERSSSSFSFLSFLFSLYFSFCFSLYFSLSLSLSLLFTNWKETVRREGKKTKDSNPFTLEVCQEKEDERSLLHPFSFSLSFSFSLPLFLSLILSFLIPSCW